MVATLDLGSVVDVSRIECAFLQDIIAWIFLPEEVEFAVSRNGKRYQDLASITRPIPAEQEGAIRVPLAIDAECPRQIHSCYSTQHETVSCLAQRCWRPKLDLL